MLTLPEPFMKLLIEDECTFDVHNMHTNLNNFISDYLFLSFFFSCTLVIFLRVLIYEILENSEIY